MIKDQEMLTEQMCKMIEAVVNTNQMTMKDREWYLNTAWGLVMKYVRKNK